MVVSVAGETWAGARRPMKEIAFWSFSQYKTGRQNARIFEFCPARSAGRFHKLRGRFELQFARCGEIAFEATQFGNCDRRQ
jgi:hypothetical protein